MHVLVLKLVTLNSSYRLSNQRVGGGDGGNRDGCHHGYK